MVHVVELGGVALHRYVFRALPFQTGRVPWPQGGGRRKPGTAPCVRWRPYSPACSFTSWRSRYRTRACFAAAMPGSSPTMTQATAIAQIYGTASMRALATPSIRAPRFRNGLPRAPQACLPRALPAPGCPNTEPRGPGAEARAVRAHRHVSLMWHMNTAFSLGSAGAAAKTTWRPR